MTRIKTRRKKQHTVKTLTPLDFDRARILASQALFVRNAGKLNPIIRGWCNYYSTVSSKEIFSNCDHVLSSQLRAWARYRTKKWNPKTRNKYWQYIENRLTFSVKSGIRLTAHSDTPIKRHVKVRGDKSYFDGDVLYWSTRKGTHPELPNQVAMLLKKYKGQCPECGLMFTGDDLIEVDHIIAKEDRGTDKFDNLQPLHRHCHDAKTAHDYQLVAGFPCWVNLSESF